jgi:uncharacterized membrane protein YebE (DUF533 family)
MNDFLVESVLRGVLGGGRKRSKKALRYLTGQGGGTFLNAGTLLTAAGVAWGIYETLEAQGAAGATGSTTGSTGSPASAGSHAAPAAVTLPPLPNLAAGGVPDDATRVMRLAVSAANADGSINEQERAAIVERAGGAADTVSGELDQRRPLADIVAGVSDPAQRATLYVLAYTIVRADEQVTGAERIYLAQLAHLLGLDPATVRTLESDTSKRIDAAE